MTQVCAKCKKEKPISEFYYHRQRKRYMTSCKICNSVSCAKYQRDKYQGTEKYVFYQRGYQISRDKANLKGIPCDENLSQLLWDLWKKQEGKCGYTGRQMDLKGYGKNNPNAMTVDRIEPLKGYISGNIVLCCSIANRVKQNLSLIELFDLVEEIKTYKKGSV